MIDGAKYAVNGFRGQLLTVTSITEHDEGIYFCQDGTSDPVLGGCLYVYSKSIKFQHLNQLIHYDYYTAGSQGSLYI